MVEEWRDIKGYEGKYQVSNMGRVKSLDRMVSRSGRVMHLREKLLKPRVNPFGYCSVHLYCNGNGKNIFIHRLVANAFIPNADNTLEINHKDEDKSNNCVENLEWCTHQYNNLYNGKAKRANQKRIGISLSDECKRKMSDNNARYWLGKRRSTDTVNKMKHSHDKSRIERGFTDDVIREINRRANSGDKLKKLAIDYGCSESYIWKIKYQKVYLMNGEW